MSSTSKFVKRLASDDRKTRDAAISSLKQYLGSKATSNLSLLDMEKLWKGLYFSMWMCDRARPQEKLAESLGELFSSVINEKDVFKAIEAFWVVIIREWPTIDQWRVDKFYMLIRRVLRHNFKFLKVHNWQDEYVNKFVDVYSRYPLSGRKEVSMALPYHLCDIYLDELELVAFEDIDTSEEGDGEVSDSNEESLIGKRKIAVIKEIPILELISPFRKLRKEASLKTLRDKCQEEVLDDKRFKTWKHVCKRTLSGNKHDHSDNDEQGSEKEEEEEEEDKEDKEDEEDEGDDWKGFD